MERKFINDFQKEQYEKGMKLRKYWEEHPLSLEEKNQQQEKNLAQEKNLQQKNTQQEQKTQKNKNV